MVEDARREFQLARLNIRRLAELQKDLRLSASQVSGGKMFGCRPIVFSRTLRPADHPEITIVAGNAAAAVTEVKRQEGKDIWLMGGGVLFHSLLEARLVDTVEVAVVPILLGGGIPMLPLPCKEVKLQLETSKALPSGILMLMYRVPY